MRGSGVESEVRGEGVDDAKVVEGAVMSGCSGCHSRDEEIARLKVERDECEHGSLRRSCEICERDEEIARLQEKYENALAQIEVWQRETLAAQTEADALWAEVERLKGKGGDDA
jgi:hypothetical protein